MEAFKAGVDEEIFFFKISGIVVITGCCNLMSIWMTIPFIQSHKVACFFSQFLYLIQMKLYMLYMLQNVMGDLGCKINVILNSISYTDNVKVNLMRWKIFALILLADPYFYCFDL